MVLEEPEKATVLRWKKGELLPPRKAAVVARVGGTSLVLTVDLDSGEVVRHETGEQAGYPTMTVEDMTSATWAPLASAEFNRTVVARGVDLADLACLPLSTGWFGKWLSCPILLRLLFSFLCDNIGFGSLLHFGVGGVLRRHLLYFDILSFIVLLIGDFHVSIIFLKQVLIN